MTNPKLEQWKPKEFSEELKEFTEKYCKDERGYFSEFRDIDISKDENAEKKLKEYTADITDDIWKLFKSVSYGEKKDIASGINLSILDDELKKISDGIKENNIPKNDFIETTCKWLDMFNIDRESRTK